MMSSRRRRDPLSPIRLLPRFLALAAAVFALCLAPVAARAQSIVINEILQNPSAVADGSGEWFELLNAGAAAVDINGWTIRDNDFDSHVITNGSPLVIPAGGFLVLANNGDSGTNGGVAVDYVYGTSFFLANGADELVLLDTFLNEIDRVEWDDGATFPDPNGASMSLIAPSLDNNLGASWCTASTSFGDGDLGTPGAANDCVVPEPVLVINEIDYDQPGTDAAEFIEITNVGTGPATLSGFELRLVNGASGGAVVYATIPLPAVSLAPGDYFVVCGDAANVANCDLDVSPNTNLIQNGAPDAVALFAGTTLIDTVSYEGNTGAPFTEGSGAGLDDDASVAAAGLSRCPDGADTNQNNVDFTFTAITPGAANDCGDGGALVINEIDYDQPGTDLAEFIEIKNVGAEAVDLSGFELRLVNGSGGAVYQTIPLPATSLAAGDYFVVCGDAATVFGCDLDVTPDSNLIQNGSPDAVALVETAGGTIVDTVSYEGDTVAPFTEGSGTGLEDPSGGGTGGPNENKGISRFPDGIDTNQNNVDFSVRCITPGKVNTAAASDCPTPGPPPLVINEIDYDQPGTDAAEFVEIKNTGSAAADLTGVELLLVNGSGGAIYDTIALPSVSLAAGDYFVVCANAATVLNCDLDDSPDTNFIQNGSPDAVALRFEGVVIDAVSYEGDTVAPFTEGSGSGLEDSGATGEDFKGISRFPDGADSDRNNLDLISVCITPGRANTNLAADCTDMGPRLEIFEIQGSGSASPFVGQTVKTVDNVVTAVGLDGFFIQTPEVRSDGDVDTSDGIFVFTGGAPAVAVGALVSVTGTAAEFFNFTEISGSPDVEVTGSGTLPPAVTFDATVPSPDPTTPSCAIEYECYEGMLIDVAAGTVSGPNQRFGTDPVAEVHVVAGPERAFREPGVLFPGLGMPPIPTWDGNPEVFELDPDKLGLPNQILPAGSSFAATGVLGFEFGGYELWPTALTFTPAPLPVPVRAEEANELTVATLNLFRLFDAVNDPPSTNPQGGTRDDAVVSAAEYARRLAKFSAYIREVLGAPDVLSVQEAEKLEVLQDLADRIAADDPAVVYTPFLIEGNDVGTIDNGFLVRDTVQVDAVIQLGATEILTFDGSLLHDRPPLLLEASFQCSDGELFPFQVMGLHQRSLGGIDDPVDGPRVRQKRFEQAQSVAAKVQAIQDADPGVKLIVNGDFNAFEFTDGFVDVVGQIKGDFVPEENLVCQTNSCDDLVDPNLENQVDSLPQEERYSFIFAGSAQVLDHALTSQGLEELVRGAEYGRGNADAAVDLINDASTVLRASDHDGLVIYLATDCDDDGVPDDQDLCPGTAIPEGVPTQSLGVNRFALVDGDGVFDTTPPPGGGMGPGASFTIDDTRGCSCEQIIAAQGLGEGHRKFGCSLSAMEEWVAMVSP